MKLRNKKTGMVITLLDHLFDNYNSLAELNAEWEDYEEPKGKALYWMILTLENFIENEADDRWVDLEDCKQMLEKLKAWERLKDKGFRFIDHIDRDSGQGMARYEWKGYVNGEDLDLIFGGEE